MSDSAQSSQVGPLASAVPMAVQAASDAANASLNPPNAAGGKIKEAPELTFTVEKPGIDQVPGVQYVEQEVSHELPPEVESFLTEVKAHQDQLPAEVVVADHSTPQSASHYAAKPVIVLPITPEVEKKGATQSPKFSVRWLVEWSRKMMKVFTGRVVYRHVEQV